MKHNYRKIIILAMLVAVSLYACDLFDTGKKYYVDNPTNAALKVVLDGNITMELAPHEYRRVKIKPGSHEISVGAGTPVSFTIKDNQPGKGGLINPLGAKYVLWTQSYAADRGASYIPTQVISWNGQEIKGPFVVDSAIYIVNSWWYDVETPFPKAVSVSDNTSEAWVSKLFRADDFTREYRKLQEQRGAQ